MSSYSNDSRYYEVVTVSGVVQEPLVVKSVPYDITYVQSNEKDRLDLVALRMYNNPSLWWRIARESGIHNPFNVPVGLQLRVPKLSI